MVFKFKKFSITQDKAAMKVGTDGVLLGAWVSPYSSPKNILDIGTGTGLIAIMLAQRFKDAKIHAIDIDKETSQEALSNANSCPWIKRLKIEHASLQNFEYPHLFDLIVCNPPYFRNTTLSDNNKRALARNNESLKLEYLIEKSSDLLNINGELALIIPNDELNTIENQAKKSNLYINQICRVKGNSKSNIKRVLLKLGKVNEALKEEHLTIEKVRHQYTEDYKNLCKDFYLKM